MPSRLLPKTPKGKRILYGKILHRRKADRVFRLKSGNREAIELVAFQYPYLGPEAHKKIAGIFLDKQLNLGEKTISLKSLLEKELSRANTVGIASSIQEAIADATKSLSVWQKSNPRAKMRKRPIAQV